MTDLVKIKCPHPRCHKIAGWIEQGSDGLYWRGRVRERLPGVDLEEAMNSKWGTPDQDPDDIDAIPDDEKHWITDPVRRPIHDPRPSVERDNTPRPTTAVRRTWLRGAATADEVSADAARNSRERPLDLAMYLPACSRCGKALILPVAQVAAKLDAYRRGDPPRTVVGEGAPDSR